jgi:hypothetical protein
VKGGFRIYLPENQRSVWMNLKSGVADAGMVNQTGYQGNIISHNYIS